jgi:hypothetical protein
MRIPPAAETFPSKIDGAFCCADSRMADMKLKPGQMPLWKIFVVVAVIASYFGIMSLITRYRTAATHELFVKGYRDTRAYFETLRSTQSAESISQMQQDLDQQWRDRHHEPVPVFP